MKDKEKWKGEENTVTRICPRVPTSGLLPLNGWNIRLPVSCLPANYYRILKDMFSRDKKARDISYGSKGIDLQVNHSSNVYTNWWMTCELLERGEDSMGRRVHRNSRFLLHKQKIGHSQRSSRPVVNNNCKRQEVDETKTWIPNEKRRRWFVTSAKFLSV